MTTLLVYVDEKVIYNNFSSTQAIKVRGRENIEFLWCLVCE